MRHVFHQAVGMAAAHDGHGAHGGVVPGFRSRDFYLLINDIQKTLLGFAAPNRVPVCSREFCVVQQQVELAGSRGTVDLSQPQPTNLQRQAGELQIRHAQPAKSHGAGYCRPCDITFALD